MSKTLYYTCPRCLTDWRDDYQEEYGECSDDCPHCGLRHINPVTKAKEFKEIKAKNEASIRKYAAKKVAEAAIQSLKESIELSRENLKWYISEKGTKTEEEKSSIKTIFSESYNKVMEEEHNKLNKKVMKFLKSLRK